MATCVGLAMVTFLSWMANAKTSSCIVRILVGNRNGSILRSVGSNNMSLLVLYLRQGWHVVCQHVRKVVLLPILGDFCFGFGSFFEFFWCLLGVLCIWGVLALAGLPVVYKIWVTQVCLLLDTPFGRRSVESNYLCNLWGEYLKNS